MSDTPSNAPPEPPAPVAETPRPPKRGGIGSIVLALALLAIGAAGGSWMMHRAHGGSPMRWPWTQSDASAAKTLYQCPMHPTIVQDHPGDCPICGMKLVQVQGGGSKDSGADAAATQYQCPMHPTIVQDHPGDCPICGMKLVEVKGASAAGAEAAEDQYQCPMHPTIVQDHPGDCPICGMKLVKVESAGGDRKVLFWRSPMDPKQTSPVPRKDEMGMDYVPVYADEASAPSAVQGLATVEIDPARQQLIGLSTAEVKKGRIGGAWRTVGKVAVDETRVRHINVKVPGFVEHIHVDFIGKPVRKGDPLFSMYSPELLAAQQEYLLALRTRAELEKAGGGLGDGDVLVSAARRKLSLWDVPQAEIDRIAASGQPTRTLTFYSPVSGVVTKKDVVEGMKLDAGAMPYELVDLSSVWVLADVYESELRHVKVAMPATLTLQAFPNRVFKGKVAFVDPMLDPQTRTVKVRISFPNPTRDLRPEMFGEVVLHGKAREGLSIPADAVIDSGREKVVFVALGQGKFQPRAVRLGESDGTNVEVVSGLDEGESVVTRANFLVDSESRLRASLSELSAGTAKAAPESARVLPGSGESAATDSGAGGP